MLVVPLVPLVPVVPVVPAAVGAVANPVPASAIAALLLALG